MYIYIYICIYIYTYIYIYIKIYQLTTFVRSVTSVMSSMSSCCSDEDGELGAWGKKTFANWPACKNMSMILKSICCGIRRGTTSGQDSHSNLRASQGQGVVPLFGGATMRVKLTSVVKFSEKILFGKFSGKFSESFQVPVFICHFADFRRMWILYAYVTSSY